MRFLGQRLSADLGDSAPLASDVFLVAPIVNFVWTFGEVRPVAATGQSPVHLGWLIRSSVGHAILGAKEPADDWPTR